MPFYEYRCSKCGHTLTKLQSMSAAPLTECPQCKEHSLVKLISASGFDIQGVGVFGNSRNPFKNDTCAQAKSNMGAGSGNSACAACPHAK